MHTVHVRCHTNRQQRTMKRAKSHKCTVTVRAEQPVAEMAAVARQRRPSKLHSEPFRSHGMVFRIMFKHVAVFLYQFKRIKADCEPHSVGQSHFCSNLYFCILFNDSWRSWGAVPLPSTARAHVPHANCVHVPAQFDIGLIHACNGIITIEIHRFYRRI